MAAGLSLSFLSILGTMLFSGGIAALPLGLPPAERDPAMAKVAPEECLFFLSWSAMREASADSANRTERLLAEPQVKRFVAVVTERLNDALKEGAGEGPNARKVAEITPRIVTSLAVHETAFFAGSFQQGPAGMTVPVGLVTRLDGDAVEFEKDLLALLEILTDQTVPRAVNGVRTLLTPPGIPKIQWKIHDGYFILGISDGTIAQIQERMAGEKVSGWLSEIQNRLPVKQVSTITYINTQAILESVSPLIGPMLLGRGGTNPLVALGLSNLESISNVSGLSEEATISRTWLKLEGEPRGLFAMIDAEPIGPEDLSTVPADATLALSWKVDPDKTFDRFLKLFEAFEPGAEQQARRELAAMQSEIGFSIEEDLFDSLGDSWNVYVSPSEGGGAFTNATAVVTVRNAKRLKAVSETIVKSVRRFERQFGQFNPRNRRIGLGTMKVGNHSIQFLNAIGEDMPVAPAWCVTDEHLVFSLFPQGVAAFLEREPTADNLTSLPHIQKALGAKNVPSKLMHVDSQAFCRAAYPLVLMGANLLFSELQREGLKVDISVMPSSNAIAKHLAPALTTVSRTEDGLEVTATRTLPVSVGATTLTALPAMAFGVSSRRVGRFGQPMSPGILDVLSPRRAARTQSTNHLKQLGLAMHNFHDTHRRFPSDIRDEDGKPLLSWRVQLLPFLDQIALFDQFNLDEPWDSPNNKPLIAKMPAVLRAPGSKAEATRTNYVGLAHENGIFRDGAGIRIADIVDGTSNTIMIAEADDKHAVIWSKPGDLAFDAETPDTGLVGLRRGGFLAAFCDGAVQFIPESISSATLVRLATRNDGQVIDFNEFRAGVSRGTTTIRRDTAPVEAVEELRDEVPRAEPPVIRRTPPPVSPIRQTVPPGAEPRQSP